MRKAIKRAKKEVRKEGEIMAAETMDLKTNAESMATTNGQIAETIPRIKITIDTHATIIIITETVKEDEAASATENIISNPEKQVQAVIDEEKEVTAANTHVMGLQLNPWNLIRPPSQIQNQRTLEQSF